MERFEFSGNPPHIESDDVIEMDEEISRYDIVTFERAAPKKIVVRVVKPKDYVEFPEAMYQLDRGERIGTYRLRQVHVLGAMAGVILRWK
jgi:hypothetical protein